MARPPDVRRALQLGTGLLVLIAIGALAIWQVPQWLDWTRYRDTIAVLASATLGQPVTIDGPVSLTLLPQPTLIAAKVGVGGDGSGVAVHVEALRLRVALWPLIAGRVDARELVLRGADLHIPWPAEPAAMPIRTPPWLAAFTARIENGTLTIGKLAFTGIDASLETHDTGALSAAGTAHFSGEAWHFIADLTSTGADGSSGLNVTLDGRGKAAGTGASFSGQFAANGSLAGTLSARGPNLATLLPAPAVPFRADGRLTVGGGLAAADDMALEIGGSPATGAVALRVAPQLRLDIALAAGRLDLDGWLPALLRAGNTVAGRSLPIGIDLSAEAAQLGGGTLRHLHATFELAGDTLRVRQASTLLPGDASLNVSGEVARQDPLHPKFDGDVTLQAAAPRTTLLWLRGLMPASIVPDFGVPQHAALAAHVSASNDAVSLRGITGTLDGTAISGKLDYAMGKPASLTADLAIDRPVLDSWASLRSLPVSDLARMAVRIYGELALSMHHAIWHGSELGELSLQAVAASGNVTLRNFEAAADGMRLTASGALTQSGRIADGKLRLATEQSAALLPLLPPEWRIAALWRGPLSLDIEAAGPPEALALHVRLAAADAQMDAQTSINLRSSAWQATATLRHPSARRFAATLDLPARLDLPVLPAWLGDGSLALIAHLSGSPGRLQADSFDVTAGTLRTDGRLLLELVSEPSLSGRLHFDTLSLPVPAAASIVPLPRALLHGWQAGLQLQADRLLVAEQPLLEAVAARVTLADGVLHVGELTGKLAGGRASAEATYDTGGTSATLSLQAVVDGAGVDGSSWAMPIDLLSGTASGSIQLEANGSSPAALIATVSGQAALNVTDGVVSGFDMFRARSAARLANRAAAQASASVAATTGTTGFDSLDLRARFAHGELLLEQASLRGNAGEAKATGVIALPDGTLDVMLVLTPAVPEPPEIAVRLNGPFDRPKRTPELAGLARWFAERAR